MFNTQGQSVKTVPLSSGGETTTFTTGNLNIRNILLPPSKPSGNGGVKLLLY
ncbi:MAG: hypothetical protein IPI59_07420 [Sphingobacteriales bacterium]|nr:hypothetical protein [Sphingobacteriales bacterium]MBP9140421.1 hypothetical protein [Chitinophagales bacterium]MDA0197314.1 hypothetical protein [Bacteroidota bacterium]MBK6890109.1 hypothetical protein [Sphingobacteriales bacterium]MBK7527364.1 hypothetical protein [Sphingobacteriales bacterium]